MMIIKRRIFWILWVLVISKLGLAMEEEELTCVGTSTGFTTVQNPEQRYSILKALYSNCTYVEGNLEISYQQDIERDFSFLKDIREVTGYVLIVLSYLPSLMLPNLRVIRGTTLFEGNALLISHNYLEGNSEIGLRELNLKSLQEIIRGNVQIVKNNQLCFADTINWDDIVSPDANVTIKYDDAVPRRECPSCENPTPNAGCWGEGTENYQQLSKVICDKTCDNRCHGPTAADCCHKSCAAGCNGPLNTECLACRDFTNGDECVESCPPKFVYDPSSYTNVLNPNFKFPYGAQCIEKCPENFLTDSETCVKHCDDGKQEKDGKCVDCDGPCPKTCDGLEKTESLDSINYQQLKGCTIIKKNIIIGVVTFLGDALNDIPPLTPEDLEIFRTVKEINGFLSVQAKHENLTNLSFFENLTVIKGREHYSSTSDTLHIQQTSLQYLGLTSLEDISSGNIRIRDNEQLCYVNNDIMWTSKLTNANEQKVKIVKRAETCKNEGRVCDAQCKQIGCWGPGPEQCVECENRKIGNKCVEDCDYKNGEYYAGNDTCKYCHEECVGGCSGPGNEECDECKNFQDGPFCVPECPKVKYNKSYTCEPCHDLCIEGCSGPSNTIGENGCHACAKVKVQQRQKLIECLPGGAFGINTTCDEGFYYERRSLKNSDTVTQVCQECHPECRNCTGKGSYNCDVCKNFRRDDQCVPTCKPDEYYDEAFECHQCHTHCKGGCNGPSASECKTDCSKYKIDTGDGKFLCATECPVDYPYQDRPYHCISNCSENTFANEKNFCRPCHEECFAGCVGDQRKDCVQCKNVIHNGECRTACPSGTDMDEDNVCKTVSMPITGQSTNQPKSGLSTSMIAGLSGVFIIILLILIVIIYSVYKRKYKDNLLELTTTLAIKQLEHPDETEPLTPSGVAPNQAQLRLIKENEMKKMSKLGSGAFGTVYKGVWTPEGEKVRIPIAIKVLQEGITAKATQELLAEAYVMASVDHPCVLRLLGVNCGQEMMLITQLMPMGALLEFTREHKGRISSQHLLLWSHQIAQGMVYLEDKHIIHRDLAARNVLVLSPNQVKITDFGLAKFLEIEEHEYKSDGGKMPIKWLALECIMTRKFTHKSDVWSFGVTLWELMTFGQKPYEHVRARDMPGILERGERLPQPPICTIDIYMLMVKCWLLDPESRPQFKQLSDELDRMAKDPSRYLVVQNDGHQTLPMTNKDDFYKSLLIDGGEADPDLFMDADDYLQPSVCTTDPAYRFPEVEDVFDENRDYLNDAVTFSSPPSSAVSYKHKGFPRTSTASLGRYSQDPTVASHLQRQRSNVSQRSNARKLLESMSKLTARRLPELYNPKNLEKEALAGQPDMPSKMVERTSISNLSSTVQDVEEPHYSHPSSDYQPLHFDKKYQPLIRAEIDGGHGEDNYENTQTIGSTSGPEDYKPIRNGPTLAVDNMEYHALLQRSPPRTNPSVMNRQMSTPVQHSPLKFPPVNNANFTSSQPLLNGQVDYQNLNNASSGHQDNLITPKRSSSVSQATSDGYLSEHDYMNSFEPPPVSPTESTV